MVDKKNATIAVLCVVMVLCLGLWFNSAQEASRLKGGLYELEDDYEKLVLVRTSLEENYSELRTEKEDLETEYSTLENDLMEQREENEDNQEEISDLENQLEQAQITILDNENEIIELGNEISALSSQLSSYQSQLSQYSSTVSQLRSELLELEVYVDDIKEIIVTQHYEWEYGTGYYPSDWSWDLDISLRIYTEYHFRPRPGHWSEWIDMVNDPYDDYYITDMVQIFNKVAIEEGYSESEKVNFVIAFVQSLPYTVDSSTTDWDEYPKYPLETLFERGGDCEDTSILVAALLDRLGYDTCLLLLSHENHCAVGVSITGTYGSYYEHDGKKYYYLETTGDGFEIGDMPSGFTDTRAYIYPINP